MKPRFLRVSYFAWLLVPALLYAGYAAYGLPHLAWSYRWIDHGQGYGPFAARRYTRCSYFGPYGEITIYPNNGRCPWVRFFKDGRVS